MKLFVILCACALGTDAPPIETGLAPTEAADKMTVPDGFRVKLAAGEPLVHQPIAFSLDDRGRIWVAEAYTYPIRAAEGKGRDKIIILEDQDSDGRFETRKVFAEGLNLVSGMEVGFGGVWVGAAPYLMFIPDADQDDQPDGPPRILLDGFGYQDTHETLNAFNWGPDGWLYGCHGVFTHSRVGKPGTPDEQRVPVNAAVWRYHPTRHVFEVFCWGTSNPWGVDFNDYGQPFITACVIPHLWHVIQGARYQRQGGRHFNSFIYDDIKTIAEHRHYVGDIRDHAWWGHEPDPPADTLAAGGGHAHCGAMIYLGDNWPDRYRNQIFMHNVHGNRVNQDRLERKGSGYVGRRAPDLLLANDKWFRGINLRYGPDGSVYLIDWYDRNACHRTNPEIWDRSNGRIYNVAFGEPKVKSVRLSSLTDAQLVQLHLEKNDWYVRMARRLLQERSASGRIDLPQVDRQLWELAQTHPDFARRLRAIWTLHVIGQLGQSRRSILVKNDNEYVRCWAIQLELEDRDVAPAMLNQLADLAESDSSPMVRLYLASALQRLPVDERWSIVSGLLSHTEDADDHNLPLMYWYGVEPLVGHDPRRALQLTESCQIPQVTKYIVRRAAADPNSIDAVAKRLRSADARQQLIILDEMLAAFEGRVEIPMPPAWNATYEQLMASPMEDIRDRADQVAILLGDQRVYPRMRELLGDPAASLDKRQQALQILVRGQDQAAAPYFHAALAEPALRSAAIRALAHCDHEATPGEILRRYASLSQEQRRDAVGTLTSRPRYADALLEAMEQQQVARTDLHAYHVRQILSFKDAALQQRLREVWGEIRESSGDKQARIKQLRETCSPQRLKDADRSNGRRIFAKTCANCHQLFGVGEQVGPNITGSNRANLDYILENIVDPSAVLGKDYRMTVLELDDGRVVSGLIQQETDSAITMRTLNDTIVVPKSSVEERHLSQLSMMPEGLLDQLETKELTDLIAYLGSPTQVALRGVQPPIDATTGQVAGAIEAESMKIVGKSHGNALSQGMQAFRGDRWSDDHQLWWTGAQPGSHLELEVPVDVDGSYVVEIVLTRAPDYGIVQLSLNDEKLGDPIDLYAATVVSSGVLLFEDKSLKAGNHRLRFDILGANPQAAKAYMVGVDYIRLVPSGK